MERTAQLQLIDQQICDYFEKHNSTKKDNIFCYKPDKKEIAQFYNTMGQGFFHNKMKLNPDSNRNNRKYYKTKSQILCNIQNPLLSCLPKQIQQKNLIKVDKGEQIKISKTPMFSQVQTSKNTKYIIAKEVMEMLAQDIKIMLKDKQQQIFRRKYPIKWWKGEKQALIDSVKTQQLIKDYNLFLSKYKNENLSDYLNLNILEQNAAHQSIDMNLNDQKFKILGVFRKIYMQTKSQNINQNLINYVKKFQMYDKLSKKTKDSKFIIKKSSLYRSSSAYSKHRPSTISQKQQIRPRQSSKTAIKKSPSLHQAGQKSCKETQQKQNITSKQNYCKKRNIQSRFAKNTYQNNPRSTHLRIKLKQCK